VTFVPLCRRERYIGSDQPKLAGPANRLIAVGRRQLAVNAPEVRLDGVNGDVHLAGDLSRAQQGLNAIEMNILTELWIGMPLLSCTATRRLNRAMEIPLVRPADRAYSGAMKVSFTCAAARAIGSPVAAA
jgi:hypothetical protein